MERRKKIALELSELVVYCRPVPFDEESEHLLAWWPLQAVTKVLQTHSVVSRASWSQFTLELWKCPSPEGGSSHPHPSVAGVCHQPEQLLRLRLESIVPHHRGWL